MKRDSDRIYNSSVLSVVLRRRLMSSPVSSLSPEGLVTKRLPFFSSVDKLLLWVGVLYERIAFSMGKERFFSDLL